MEAQRLNHWTAREVLTFFFFFYVLFHYGLSQEIGYSSLCYTVGPCLSILNVLKYHFLISLFFTQFPRIAF